MTFAANFEIILLVQAAGLVILAATLVYLGFVYRTAIKDRGLLKERIRERDAQRFARLLRHLDIMFRRRTGLSGRLLALALEGESEKSANIDGYKVETEEFLQRLVDDLQHALSDFTDNQCVVTIKLLYHDPKTDAAMVETIFRDSFSADSRKEQFSAKEPFRPKDHFMFKEIIERMPFDAFLAFDNIKRDCPSYFHPSNHWRSFFNSSAVHAISSPDNSESERIFGFLCVDNKKGGLDADVTRYTLSIASTAIFYVLTATMSLDEYSEEKLAGEE